MGFQYLLYLGFRMRIYTEHERRLHPTSSFPVLTPVAAGSFVGQHGTYCRGPRDNPGGFAISERRCERFPCAFTTQESERLIPERSIWVYSTSTVSYQLSNHILPTRFLSIHRQYPSQVSTLVLTVRPSKGFFQPHDDRPSPDD